MAVPDRASSPKRKAVVNSEATESSTTTPAIKPAASTGAAKPAAKPTKPAPAKPTEAAAETAPKEYVISPAMMRELYAMGHDAESAVNYIRRYREKFG